MICKNGDCNRDYAIVFSTPWCGPCKQMRPFIGRLQAEKYRVYYWYTDDFPDAARRFQIDTVPTTLFFDHGVLQKKFIGLIGEGEFRSRLKPRTNYDLIGE